MKRLNIPVFGLFGSCLLLGAATGRGETVVSHVAEGETALAGDVVLGEGTSLYKTGGGSLSLDAWRMSRTSDGRVSVLEGTLAVSAGESGDFSTPPVVCGKAAFWVNETSLVTTNSIAVGDESPPVYVSKWCDVREQTPETPSRLYAVPKWFGSAAHPAERNGIDPEKTTFNALPGVWFGGASSGQYMRWRRAGLETSLADVRHLFIVHAIANSMGHPVGCETAGQGRNGPFLNTVGGVTPTFDATKPPMMLVNRGDVCGPQASARFYLNGRQIDPRTTRQTAGWQLFACDYYDVLPKADNFYRSGFQETLQGCQGGDYLGEVLVFTNQLSETERATVERYLLAKWRLPQAKGLAPRVARTELALADGALATVAGAAGTDTPPLSFVGAGNVAKSGAGVLTLGPTDGTSFAGEFDWTAGAIRLQGGRLPALAVGGGETYAFFNSMASDAPSVAGDAASGLTCEKTMGGAADVVQTTGNGWLRVHTVKPGVRRLNVGIEDNRRGAVLQLEGHVRQTNAPLGGGAEVQFPNPDLEQPCTLTDTAYDRARIKSGETLNGWTVRQGDGEAWILCTQPNAAGGYNGEIWLPSETPSPNGGTNVLQLVGQVTVSTTVTMPCSGVYELSFDAKSRWNHRSGTYAGYQPQTEIMLGRSWDAAVCVATAPIGCHQFGRFRFRVEIAEGGDWMVGVRAVDAMRGQSCVFLDNFRMVRVADSSTEEICKIPNGSFDRLVRPVSSPYVHARFCTLNEVDGWTLSVLPDAPYANAVTNGAVGVITSGTPVNDWSLMTFFPFAESVCGAAALGFLSTGGWATTTFTVPAGTWRLRGLVQRLASYMNILSQGVSLTGTPVFRATLTKADGSMVDLGTVTAATQRLRSVCWPESFTVGAEESVTLTLSQTKSDAMGLLDELELVRESTADFGNLVTDPGFEDWGWKGYRVPGLPSEEGTDGWKNGWLVSYRYLPQHWGYCAYEGDNRLRLQNGCGVYQDIRIPQAGRYRFTMHVRARADSANYANNPVRVWLAQGATTNVIATTPSLYTRNWVEVSYLANVPTAGIYRLGIEGRYSVGDDGTTISRDTQIDGVSLARCRDEQDDAPSLPHNLRISVAEGAKLLLDYPGVARCGPVKYAGKRYVGTLNQETCPSFITGIGTLEAAPDGLAIVIR